MSSPQEIWSLRLQRELLALTTTNAETATDKGKGEGTKTKKDDTSNIGILPPFITVKDHEMNIEEGVCTVSFNVAVEKSEEQLKREETEEGKVATAEGEEQKEKPEQKDQEEVNEQDDATESTEQTESSAENPEEIQTAKKEEGETPEEKQEPSVSNDTAEAKTDTPTEEAPAKDATSTQQSSVTITLDASLELNRQKGNTTNKLTYPFQKPKAILTRGASLFPEGSNIKDGDTIDIDCDWTPSLHLNDAILNLALKVRECIKRDEPYYSGASSLWAGMEQFPQEEIAAAISKSVNQSTAKVSSFFSSLKSKASAMADELDKAVEDTSDQNQQQQQPNQGAEAQQQKSRPGLRGIGVKTKKKKEPKKKVVDESNVENGDIIDLSSAPWNAAVGLYPCKAIRRPEFIETAMSLASTQDGKKVAGAGVAGAGSMFRSFRQSAKSLVEESFLMLTEENIFEIKCNKFAVANATVAYVIPVSSLAKLKFRRQESLSLFFKQAVDDPIIYMCESSAEAVKQLQNILKRYGVKGKHTNASMQRSIQLAVQMISEIELREKELEEAPSRERVEEIMDLYRLAAENFEMAGDARHKEVMKHLHDFLAKPLIASIVESNVKEKENSNQDVEEVKNNEKLEPVNLVEGKANEISEPGEKVDKNVKIIAAEPADIEAKAVKNEEPKPSIAETDADVSMDFEDQIEEPISADENADGTEDFDAALQAAEDMLKDAHDDLKDLGIDDDVDDLDIGAPVASSGDGGEDDLVSEFEDMLKDADKELEELMGSS